MVQEQTSSLTSLFAVLKAHSVSWTRVANIFSGFFLYQVNHSMALSQCYAIMNSLLPPQITRFIRERDYHVPDWLEGHPEEHYDKLILD